MKRYAGKFFDVINASYAELYEVIPQNEMAMKQTVDQFKLMIRHDFLCLVLDEQENPVGCALIFPAIGEILNKYRGRMTPGMILSLLKFAKKPTTPTRTAPITRSNVVAYAVRHSSSSASAPIDCSTR